jgi:hypothetical protein
MDRQLLISNTIKKIEQLPDNQIKEVSDFTEFLLSKIDEVIIQEGIQILVSESKTFDFLKNEEDLYSVNDLKVN